MIRASRTVVVEEGPDFPHHGADHQDEQECIERLTEDGTTQPGPAQHRTEAELHRQHVVEERRKLTCRRSHRRRRERALLQGGQSGLRLAYHRETLRGPHRERPGHKGLPRRRDRTTLLAGAASCATIRRAAPVRAVRSRRSRGGPPPEAHGQSQHQPGQGAGPALEGEDAAQHCRQPAAQGGEAEASLGSDCQTMAYGQTQTVAPVARATCGSSRPPA